MRKDLKILREFGNAFLEECGFQYFGLTYSGYHYRFKKNGIVLYMSNYDQDHIKDVFITDVVSEGSSWMPCSINVKELQESQTLQRYFEFFLATL